MTTALITELAGRYRLHPDTIAFFLAPTLRRHASDAASLADLRGSLGPVKYHQILYNLSHVERGRWILNLARQRLGMPPKGALPPSVLDIGCGIGGTLIAFGDAGFRLNGIELDSARTTMCQRNLAQNGMEATIESVDLCETGLGGRSFQVVVCNSVIEHVNDPDAMIRRFGELVAPGGVLIMGVANCEALGNAIGDPHYGLFGLTFTPPELARGLYDALAEQRQNYSVTEWRSIDRYCAAISAAIGPVERIPPADDIRGMAAVPNLLARLTALFDTTISGPRLAKHPALIKPLEASMAGYLGRVLYEYREVTEGRPDQHFLDTFMRKSFQLVAMRPGSPEVAT
jgi:SAM-dependent methyltransferase